jgi:flagellar hook-associated protein 3 FlgL
MTRVSENSQTHALQFALNKVKRKLEDLQVQGSTLKKITKPSDDPVGNIEILTLSSRKSDNEQFIRNIQYGLMNLNIVEQSLDQLTEVMNKAKELAIQQSSDFYDPEIRAGVATEVKQLRNHAMAIANKRVGQKYIFAGFNTLQQPFNQDGTYNGDKGHITLEVSKDFFVPINMHGEEIFYVADDTEITAPHPLNRFKEMKSSPNHNAKEGEEVLDEVDLVDQGRDLASVEEKGTFKQRSNIFSVLDSLVAAMENNDTDLIQDLLPRIDKISSRLITLRAKVGSITNSIESAKSSIEVEDINAMERKSKLADADIAELFTDIQREQAILKTTYKSGQNLINTNLLDFLR